VVFSTGVGRFASNMCQWRETACPRETASYICEKENQTAQHIIYHCQAFRPPNALDDLASPGPESVRWLARLLGIAWVSLLIRKNMLFKHFSLQRTNNFWNWPRHTYFMQAKTHSTQTL